jgi:UPF0755 protein
MMTRRVRWWISVVAVLVAAVSIASACSWWAWQSLHRPYKGYRGAELRHEVLPGQDARSILRNLETKGVLRNATLTRLYLVYVLGDPPLRAGEYLFEAPLAAPEVLDKLIKGIVVTYPVTIVEGLTLQETAELLAMRGFGDPQELLREMLVTDRISGLDPTASSLEGYLFPDTYSFAKGTSEREVVSTLVSNFLRLFERQVRPLLVPDDERTPRQIVILASIVEKEARLAEERPIIAGVYVNRLRRGIALYADPTIIYALKQEGQWDGNLRRPDLKLDSPYNTYLHAGLPPGPIASPGLASLKAAARPAEVPYLYFVSRNDGSHVFASTLAEHNRNVNRWQKIYWQERWADEKRQRDPRP